MNEGNYLTGIVMADPPDGPDSRVFIPQEMGDHFSIVKITMTSRSHVYLWFQPGMKVGPRRVKHITMDYLLRGLHKGYLKEVAKESPKASYFDTAR